MPALDWEFSRKQLEFIQAAERYVCYSGGYRGGKTVSLCAKLIFRASKPRAREGLARKTLKALKGSTLRTLLEGDGNTPPLLPPGSYDHNKQEQTIALKGGGQIVYFGLDDPENIAGYTLTGCGLDEATQLDEQDWTTVDGRVSTKLDGLPLQIYAACNPATPEHFLCKKFGFAGVVPLPDHRGILTATHENPFLPPEVLKALSGFTGVRRQRYYEGLWVGAEGLVYDDWSRDRHVKKSVREWDREILAVDDGIRDPFVVLRVCQDSKGIHVERETYEPGLLMARKTAVVAEMLRGAEAVVYDSAAAELGEELRNVGLPVRPAKKKRDEGITKIQQRLADGTLTVDPSCENLIREIESYEWREGTEIAKDGNDHACDALRYGVMYLDGRSPSLGGWYSTKETDAKEQKEESIEQYYARIQSDPFKYFNATTRANRYRNN